MPFHIEKKVKIFFMFGISCIQLLKSRAFSVGIPSINGVKTGQIARDMGKKMMTSKPVFGLINSVKVRIDR